MHEYRCRFRDPYDSMELRMVERQPVSYPSGREERKARRAKQRKLNKAKC